MPLHLIELHHTSIFHQLQLEEALLRADDRNYCLINHGTPPAIVMKRTAVLEEMVALDRVREKPVPMIRRFSGGGTVFVDPDTLFVTWICNATFAGVPGFMDRIMQWSADIYRPIFAGHGFDLRENDYVLGDRKCGGSAQYIGRNRWCLHSSLLWDYQPENMRYLKFPKKHPEYRGDRSHDDFLCRLREVFPDSMESLRQAILRGIYARFPVQPVSREEAAVVLERPHRQTTERVCIF